MGSIYVNKVDADHFLVRSAPDYPHLIGKWLISISLPYSMWPGRSTQACVVDDFGNLVAVQA